MSIVPSLLLLMLASVGCLQKTVVRDYTARMENGHVVLIEKDRYLCPIGQGDLFRSYFTFMRQHGGFSQVVTEWRFMLFLPYWHADYVATLLESDEPVLGNIHRLTMMFSHTPYPSTGGIVARNGNDYVVEVVDCDIKEFLPSNPYMLAADALKTAFKEIAP